MMSSISFYSSNIELCSIGNKNLCSFSVQISHTNAFSSPIAARFVYIRCIKWLVEFWGVYVFELMLEHTHICRLQPNRHSETYSSFVGSILRCVYSTTIRIIHGRYRTQWLVLLGVKTIHSVLLNRIWFTSPITHTQHLRK